MGSEIGGKVALREPQRPGIGQVLRGNAFFGTGGGAWSDHVSPLAEAATGTSSFEAILSDVTARIS